MKGRDPCHDRVHRDRLLGSRVHALFPWCHPPFWIVRQINDGLSVSDSGCFLSVSCFPCPISLSLFLACDSRFLFSILYFLFCSLRSPLSAFLSPFPVLRSPFFILRSSFSVLRSPLSALRSPPSALRPPSSVLRPPSSVLRPPFSVFDPFSDWSLRKFYLQSFPQC